MMRVSLLQSMRVVKAILSLSYILPFSIFLQTLHTFFICKVDAFSAGVEAIESLRFPCQKICPGSDDGMGKWAGWGWVAGV